jgi:putative membrane protein
LTSLKPFITRLNNPFAERFLRVFIEKPAPAFSSVCFTFFLYYNLREDPRFGFLPGIAANIPVVDSHKYDHRFAHLVAFAFGNLELIYSTRLDERALLEAIEKIYHGMLDGLAEYEGIGSLMVNFKEHDPEIVSAQGQFYLNENQVEGQNPLIGFVHNIVNHLKRTKSFADAPDIFVNSYFDPEKQEGAAFEKLINFQGGWGGYQTQPFLLYPSEWNSEDDFLVGVEAVYEFPKNQLVELQAN